MCDRRIVIPTGRPMAYPISGLEYYNIELDLTSKGACVTILPDLIFVASVLAVIYAKNYALPQTDIPRSSGKGKGGTARSDCVRW